MGTNEETRESTRARRSGNPATERKERSVQDSGEGVLVVTLQSGEMPDGYRFEQPRESLLGQAFLLAVAEAGVQANPGASENRGCAAQAAHYLVEVDGTTFRVGAGFVSDAIVSRGLWPEAPAATAGYDQDLAYLMRVAEVQFEGFKAMVDEEQQSGRW